MAEFKQISNVDVIDALTDNDNVLVVGSDGALKQTSSSNIKGSSGIVFKPKNFYWDDDADCLCIEDNYDELYEVLKNGGFVSIDLTEYYDGDYYLPMDYTNIDCIHEPVGNWCLTDKGLFVGTWDCGLIFPNGSHNLPEKEQPAPSAN